jgi:hypothetical protein
MKSIITKITFATTILVSAKAYSQGFVNLDFENTVIVSSQPSGDGFNSGTANVSGWTEYNGWGDANYSGGTTLAYNTITLDAPGVCAEGADYVQPALQGQYSINLEGGDTPSMTTGAAIGQTGTIPLGTLSLTFIASFNGTLQVTFNGQPIDYLVTGSTADYTIYSADISAYAGQTGQLLFRAPYENYALLDNIQFSTSPVPEPSVFALTALGSLLLGFRRWKK